MADWELEEEKKCEREVSEVRQLTDFIIVRKEGAEHPKASAPNPLTTAQLANSIPPLHRSTDWGQWPILTHYNIRSLMQGV